jgi:hypothetical protein
MVPETRDEEGAVILKGEVIVETGDEAVSLLHPQTTPDGNPTIFTVNELLLYFYRNSPVPFNRTSCNFLCLGII